ncbi:MAG: nuclear transport factor 2 family protein [Arthrobacter sp.]
MENELVELETAGWHALSTGPEEATAFYAETLASQPVVLLTNGLRITDRQQRVDSMTGPPWSAFEILDAREDYLGDDAGFLTYRVRADRDGVPYTALLSSVYVKEDGEWKLAPSYSWQKDYPSAPRSYRPCGGQTRRPLTVASAVLCQYPALYRVRTPSGISPLVQDSPLKPSETSTCAGECVPQSPARIRRPPLPVAADAGVCSARGHQITLST